MSTFDPDYDHDITQGTTHLATALIKKLVKDPLPTFQRMVVLETISDPSYIDEAKIEYWKNVIKVSNSSMRFVKVLPRNTVIAQNTLVGVTEINQPMFFLPFFPSHLSLPCKPGEVIWTMFEDPNARIKEVGFWFCKVATPHFTDDVNHTHYSQQLDHSFNSTIKKQMSGTDKAVYELQNGKVSTSKDGTRFVVDGSKVLSLPHFAKDELIFEKLVTESDASRMMQYEPVPRFKKRPGDVALEGSNNTLIVLGTDRNGPVSEYEDTQNENNEIGGFAPVYPTYDQDKAAGSIDLVAGRGYTKATGGEAASLISLESGQELNKVLEKHKPVPSEGDPDFRGDRSRILISQRALPDNKFGIAEYMSVVNKIGDALPGGDAAVVIKSDKVRIVARSDISFVVTNYADKTKEDVGVQYKDEETDISKWASITIRKNGDIIFTPSQDGFVKLGGDDANQAILCTSFPADLTTGPEGSEVGALPIATTGGGFVGSAFGNIDDEAVNLTRAPDLGTFSTKVLIK